MIFENKLKAGTAPAIQALRAAHLACRMITGDNALTAVSVARECGLVNQTAHVFAPAFVRGACRGRARVRFADAGCCGCLGNAGTPMAKLEWTCMDDPAWELDDYSLRPLTPPAHHAMEGDMLDYQDYALVITGDVFRWMMSHAPLETLQRVGPFAISTICARADVRVWAGGRTDRCWRRRRCSRGCRRTRRTRWWSGCRRWGTRC